jgi:hypothetical protein
MGDSAAAIAAAISVLFFILIPDLFGFIDLN